MRSGPVDVGREAPRRRLRGADALQSRVHQADGFSRASVAPLRSDGPSRVSARCEPTGQRKILSKDHRLRWAALHCGNRPRRHRGRARRRLHVPLLAAAREDPRASSRATPLGGQRPGDRRVNSGSQLEGLLRPASTLSDRERCDPVDRLQRRRHAVARQRIAHAQRRDRRLAAGCRGGPQGTPPRGDPLRGQRGRLGGLRRIRVAGLDRRPRQAQAISRLGRVAAGGGWPGRDRAALPARRGRAADLPPHRGTVPRRRRRRSRVFQRLAPDADGAHEGHQRPRRTVPRQILANRQ